MTETFAAPGSPCPARANSGASMVSGEDVLTCDKVLGAYGEHSGSHHDPMKGDWSQMLADPAFDPLAGTVPYDPAELPPGIPLTLTSSNPTGLTQGTSSNTVVLTGSGFVDGLMAGLNGVAVPTTFTDETTASFVTVVEMTEPAGQAAIYVYIPGGDRSNDIPFTIWGA